MVLNYQNLIPQHLLTRLLGKLANARLGFLTHWGIKQFIARYCVDMREAKIEDYHEFQTFNDFFTRALKNGARPLCDDQRKMISPVDGCVSVCGYIEQDQIFQAKGAYFSLRDLCAGNKIHQSFENGAFLTAYLAPKDYHRYHMPVTGKLLKMIYVPGELFSVNHASVQQVPGLFARNERVICIFETDIGKIAYIAVGAMIVGSIAMKWHGIVAPQKNRVVTEWDYADQNIVLQRGEEVGHFRLGSTVVLLCERDKITWDTKMRPEKILRMGEAIGTI